MTAPKVEIFMCARDLRADCCDAYEAGGIKIRDGGIVIVISAT